MHSYIDSILSIYYHVRMKHKEITEIILEVFNLNGLLIDRGNTLVKDLGLTSARWQVLGAIHQSEYPPTVSDIARTMGLTRQSVQRIVNELVQEDILEFKHNAQDKRANLVTLKSTGKTIYQKAMERQKPWSEALVSDINQNDLKITLSVLKALHVKLEKEEGH